MGAKIEANYVEHLDGLEQLMNQIRQIHSETERTDANIQGSINDLLFEANLEYGQIPTIPDEILNDNQTITFGLEYKAPDGSNDFKLKFFFNTSNDRSKTKHRPEYFESNINLQITKDLRSIVKGMEQNGIEISYERADERTEGRKISDTHFHFYGREWSPNKKLDFFKNVLRQLFSQEEYKSEITEIDISDARTNYLSQIESEKKELIAKFKTLKSKYDTENKNKFSESEISSLSSYSKRFMELDNMITDIVKNQEEPYVFDMLSTISTTSYMKGRLQPIGVYTTKLREFTQEDGHENSIFRRMELISKEMGSLFKETHAKYFAERAKFYKGLASNKQ